MAEEFDAEVTTRLRAEKTLRRGERRERKQSYMLLDLAKEESVASGDLPRALAEINPLPNTRPHPMLSCANRAPLLRKTMARTAKGEAMAESVSFHQNNRIRSHDKNAREFVTVIAKSRGVRISANEPFEQTDLTPTASPKWVNAITGKTQNSVPLQIVRLQTHLIWGCLLPSLGDTASYSFSFIRLPNARPE